MSKNKNELEILKESGGITTFGIFKKGMEILKFLSERDPLVVAAHKEANKQGYREIARGKFLGPHCYGEFSDANGNNTYWMIPEVYKITNKRLIDLTHLSEYSKLSSFDRLIFDEFIKMHWEYKETATAGGDWDTYNENTFYVIYHFPTYDLHVRFEGIFTSHNGATIKSFEEVKPKEKVIIVYE